MKTKEEIINIVKEIAYNLIDYEQLIATVTKESNVRHMLDMEVNAWNEKSLSHGIPAICMLYGELSEQFPEENWDMEGHKYLTRLVQEIQKTGIKVASMFSGAAGIGLSALCLSSNLKKYTKFIHSINEYMAYVLPPMLEYSKGVGSVISCYDTIEGISGITSYLLQFKEDNKMNELAIQNIKYLIHLTKDIEYKNTKVPGWFVSSENQFTKMESDLYKNGNFNTSMSHGIAGIISILSQALMDGVEVDYQREAIEKMIKFLEDFKQKDDKNCTFWKGQISYEEVIEGKPSNENIIRRDAWCYGNIGISYAYVCAGKALKNTTYVETGIEVLRESLVDIKGIYSPTFCHGYAGILKVLNSVESLIGKQIFIKEKEMLKEKIISYYEEEYIYKFYNVEFEKGMYNKNFEYVGLLDGVVGTCLVLLDHELGSKTPWHKAFLLYD